YDEGPVLIEALDTRDPSLSAGLDQPPTITLDQKVPYGYTADGVSGPGTVLLAEAEHPGWNASFDGEELERTEGGWGNAFALPAGEGDLEVSVDRSLGQILWSIIIFAAWLVVIGASFSKRREPEVGRSVAP
ncbi:MAG TPA: hypothetical protein VFS18_04090, partial [Actinomycetota bacterium]|nr:hypothetical protein [Actinomycetota bacterium]